MRAASTRTPSPRTCHRAATVRVSGAGSGGLHAAAVGRGRRTTAQPGATLRTLRACATCRSATGDWLTRRSVALQAASAGSPAGAAHFAFSTAYGVASPAGTGAFAHDAAGAAVARIGLHVGACAAAATQTGVADVSGTARFTVSTARIGHRFASSTHATQAIVACGSSATCLPCSAARFGHIADACVARQSRCTRSARATRLPCTSTFDRWRADRIRAYQSGRASVARTTRLSFTSAFGTRCTHARLADEFGFARASRTATLSHAPARFCTEAHASRAGESRVTERAFATRLAFATAHGIVRRSTRFGGEGRALGAAHDEDKCECETGTHDALSVHSACRPQIRLSPKKQGNFDSK